MKSSILFVFFLLWINFLIINKTIRESNIESKIKATRDPTHPHMFHPHSQNHNVGIESNSNIILAKFIGITSSSILMYVTF